LFHFQSLFSTACTYFYEFSAVPIRATLVRFHMTIKTSLSISETDQRATSHPAADPKALRAVFPWPPCHARHRGRLIANARLEIDLTHGKESLLRIPNRKWTRVLHAPWRIAIFHCAVQLRPSSLATRSPRGASESTTGHSPLTTAFLIYGLAIRDPRKALKT
jgi:hypothetical protein